VLDVGSGTGGWLIETARAYPTIEQLVGVDVSNKMTTYARARAEAEHLSERVQFQTMDALRLLEFPPASFDLVNQRAATSWLRTWEWKKILLEYQRVSRPGGIIRITELGGAETNSPALTKLNAVGLEASYNSGLLFTAGFDGVACELVNLLTQHGITNVQTRLHTLIFRAGTPSGNAFCADMTYLFHVAKPFYQKWTRLPNDYEEIYEQAKKEMRAADFVAVWTFLTVWGTRPDGDLPSMRGLL
jgi:ubiquinone/menaquinone biosynthesis C-methylase UbiE